MFYTPIHTTFKHINNRFQRVFIVESFLSVLATIRSNLHFFQSKNSILFALTSKTNVIDNKGIIFFFEYS